VNSLPKTVTRQRRDLNPGHSAPESSTLTARLPSHPGVVVVVVVVAYLLSCYDACMHLKHNSWPTPHPSVICVELLGGSRQPVTGRLATHPSNTPVKIYRVGQKVGHKLMTVILSNLNRFEKMHSKIPW